MNYKMNYDKYPETKIEGFDKEAFGTISAMEKELSTVIVLL